MTELFKAYIALCRKKLLVLGANPMHNTALIRKGCAMADFKRNPEH